MKRESEKKGIYKAVLASLLAWALIGCSETEFNERSTTSQSYDVMVGQVDILFVVDNSGSMSEEQRRMGESFPNFVQGLNLAGLDYRIGIITMAVVPKEEERDFGQGRGALENGRLIQFPNGSYYLTPQTQNIETEFWGGIKRDETVVCENSGYDNSVCPSTDERGVYAAYQAVDTNNRNFFRKDGHLAFVFLTDEDVRGEGLNNHPYRAPEALDYPANLLQVVQTKLGASTDVSAHAIVTDSEACRQQQMHQGGNSEIHGVIGEFYMSMTSPDNSPLIGGKARLGDYYGGQLLEGTVGSICAPDYVQELGSIKDVLTKTKSVEKLRCIVSREDTLKVKVNEAYSWKLSEAKDAVEFNPPLPAGQSFKIEYDCYK